MSEGQKHIHNSRIRRFIVSTCCNRIRGLHPHGHIRVLHSGHHRDVRDVRNLLRGTGGEGADNGDGSRTDGEQGNRRAS